MVNPLAQSWLASHWAPLSAQGSSAVQLALRWAQGWLALQKAHLLVQRKWVLSSAPTSSALLMGCKWALRKLAFQ